jgi:hypothetical protein
MRNYCTATPDFIAANINHCCLAHDTAYVVQLDKVQADLEFYHCIAGIYGILPAAIIGGIASIGGCYFWYRRKWKNKVK